MNLYNELANVDIFIDGNIDYTKAGFQRFRARGSKSKSIFVVVHDNGAGFSFGDWKDSSTWRTVWADHKPTGRQLIAQRKVFADVKKEKEVASLNLSVRLNKLLTYAIDAAETHSYVIEKRIITYYSSILRSSLVIPLSNMACEIVSAQYITYRHFKRFARGISPKGLGSILGRIVDGCDIYICEGYATGCSIKEAVCETVVCAMSASNLINVALSIRKNYPRCRLHVCADNDKAGLDAAREVSNLTGAKIYIPFINNYDFNDLFCEYGIEEVERVFFN